jgi:hypothetical protein
MRRRSQEIAKVRVCQVAKAPRVRLLRIVNVVAGIGILGQAWAMREEMLPVYVAAAAAAGLIGLLNLRGRSG